MEAKDVTMEAYCFNYHSKRRNGNPAGNAEERSSGDSTHMPAVRNQSVSDW